MKICKSCKYFMPFSKGCENGLCAAVFDPYFTMAENAVVKGLYDFVVDHNADCYYFEAIDKDEIYSDEQDDFAEFAKKNGGCK